MSKPTPPKAPIGWAPNETAAEPVEDIIAQFTMMNAPDNSRTGVYISPNTVQYLARVPHCANMLHGMILGRDIDGQGGILVAAKQDMIDWAVAEIKSGIPYQCAIGRLTNNGEGNHPGADQVVRVTNSLGAVIQEETTTLENVPAVIKKHHRPGLTIKVVHIDNAIADREARRAAEELFTQEMDAEIKKEQGQAE